MMPHKGHAGHKTARTVLPASVECQKLALGTREILPPQAHTSVAETQLSPIIVYLFVYKQFDLFVYKQFDFTISVIPLRLVVITREQNIQNMYDKKIERQYERPK